MYCYLKVEQGPFWIQARKIIIIKSKTKKGQKTFFVVSSSEAFISESFSPKFISFFFVFISLFLKILIISVLIWLNFKNSENKKTFNNQAIIFYLKKLIKPCFLFRIIIIKLKKFLILIFFHSRSHLKNSICGYFMKIQSPNFTNIFFKKYQALCHNLKNFPINIISSPCIKQEKINWIWRTLMLIKFYKKISMDFETFVQKIF